MLDMFTNCMYDQFALISHSVDIDFLGPLNKLVYLAQLYAAVLA